MRLSMSRQLMGPVMGRVCRGLGILCIISILLLVIKVHMGSQPSSSDERKESERVLDTEVATSSVPVEDKAGLLRQMSGGRKVILLWNSFFGTPDYGAGGFGTTAFTRSECPHTCWTTNDHTYLEYADAVLVHTFNMGPRFQNVTMPVRANRQQIFVFFIFESPLRSYDGFQDTGFSFKDVFNLTFTYLDVPDTDVYVPLGGVKRRDEPPDIFLPTEESVRDKNLIAWFVSHCDAPSARLTYARELGKHAPVHIYGKCGNGSYVCPPGEIECYSKIIQSYLFYLAFENSYCDDYVTEKVFRTMTSHMVPIVYGKANYSAMLPAKSYIDVRDFSSPWHLANHLLMLQKNPHKYMEYMQWKRHYSMIQEGDLKMEGFCKLCSILHDENYPYKSRYDPVELYWQPNNLCMVGEEEREEVNLIL